MRRDLKRHLLLALALAVVIVGVALAVATSGGGGGGSGRAHAAQASAPVGELAIAARYLGMTRRELRRRLQVATLAEIADATKGRSAAGLEKALLAPSEAQAQAEKLSPSEAAARAAKAREQVQQAVTHRRGAPAGIALAAGYLGISQAALRSDLAHGHSLGSLAQTGTGTSRDGLIALIVGNRRKRLERALAAGAITPRQEHAAVARLRLRVARQVDRRTH